MDGPPRPAHHVTSWSRVAGSTCRWPCVLLISTSISGYMSDIPQGMRPLEHARFFSIKRARPAKPAIPGPPHVSCRPVFGILDASVVDADQRLDQAVADLGDLAQGEPALVELAVAEPLIDQVADQPLQP